ncbi:UbiD family decarboxylase [Rhodoplanes roseus]|uniref:UbiD family decarboxylase n=1 Tax=Rhodoplanes roseus TaxID=29409 RepID=A0A327KXX8_9BRAD|nr:UbiD family decarboxylase [Rhodoplanes roseus]RAI40258.1 hypothetical protein CH341_24130 [Rhodoplanes roseus]
MPDTRDRDLRSFIDRVDALGALRKVAGAHPVHEIGAITEVAAGKPNAPALLFSDIAGCDPRFRIFTNATTTPQRAALALGIDPMLPPLAALKAWMQRRQTLKRLPPVNVPDGACLQTIVAEDDVDLGRYPVPVWHKADGGPYIGSGSIVVMRDPDDGWINASIYRVQVHNRSQVTVQFDHTGRHGAIIAKKYWDRGRSCPVAIVNGPDPSLFVAGFEYLPEGYSEYDFAGAIRGAPLETIAAPLTGLPVPGSSEMILEGDLLPMTQQTLPEGPFGEFTGYYAADTRPGPVMNVRGICHRDDCILFGSPPMKPPRFHFGLPLRAAGLWEALATAGITDVVGAWQHVSQLMTVIAIRQRYGGHAKRAGLMAAANSYMARLVVVVDDDIDPSNLADVMWAVTTRSEPAETIDIVRDAWSSALDPRIPPDRKAAGVTSHSKLIIDACKPFAWRDDFPTSTALSADEAARIEAKWGAVIA